MGNAKRPKYFMASFGEKYANKHPVDGGCYPVASYCKDASKVSKGDVMLLYCTGTYPEYYKEAPGIGKVTDRKEMGGEVYIYYKYESLASPIGRGIINDCLTPDERHKFRYSPRLRIWNLFEIEPLSFQCIIGGKRRAGNMPDYKFTVVVERDEDGLYVASVPLLQGCYTQGKTYEEALENIKDAIKLHIEARRALGEPVPIEVAIDEVQVVA